MDRGAKSAPSFEVWIRTNANIWVEGTIRRAGDGKYVVRTRDGKDMPACSDNVCPKVPDSESLVEDVSTLPYLEEPTILRTLVLRYGQGETCTFCGDVLVVMPSGGGPPDSSSLSSTGRALQQQPRKACLEYVAFQAHRGLELCGPDQVVVVTGEEGCGQSQARCFMVDCFWRLGGSRPVWRDQFCQVTSAVIQSCKSHACARRRDAPHRITRAFAA